MTFFSVGCQGNHLSKRGLQLTLKLIYGSREEGVSAEEELPGIQCLPQGRDSEEDSHHAGKSGDNDEDYWH